MQRGGLGGAGSHPSSWMRRVGAGITALQHHKVLVCPAREWAAAHESLHTCAQALLLSHPRKLIRDTARYPPLMRATAPGRRPKPRALRHLAAQHLGLTIQAGEHSPVDDARAALYLYLRFQKVRSLYLPCLFVYRCHIASGSPNNELSAWDRSSSQYSAAILRRARL